MANFDCISVLKIADSPTFTKFLHDCVDDFIGRKLQTIDTNNSDIEWSADEQKKARKSIQNLFQQLTVEGEDKVENKEIPDDALAKINDCYEIRKNDILEHLLKECILQKGHNLVENFDWKLKWIMGSSSLATLREPLLQIDLNCISKTDFGNREKKTVNFEVDLKQLDLLISELENVKSNFNN